ncbi:MAG: TetR/AcrR family transcriptional regulator [Pseudomonadota bacterium]
MNGIIKKKAPGKKNAILEAAVKVFAESGYQKATIADLARRAGLSEATIYNYFKNKEDILLTIPEQWAVEFLDLFTAHQAGLRDPEEKLRKFIWLYLYWMKDQPEYTKVFLMEIQPNDNYYTSNAFKLLKEISTLPLPILKEGQDAGLFRAEVPPKLFRHFLMGAANYLLLSRLIFNRPVELSYDFEQLSRLILASIRRGNDPALPPVGKREEKRDRILNAAELLFSQKSINQVRISEIAGLANVADGTIYEYFQNKEDLLFAVFGRRTEDFNLTFEQALSPRDPAARLRAALRHFLGWARDNRPWARVYFKDLIANPRFYESRQYEPMRLYTRKLRSILEEGRAAGIFRPDAPMFFFRSLVFGTMGHICAPWAMLNQEHDLLEDLPGFFDLVHQAVKVDGSAAP